tara:strand:+ start:15615 stop:16583 length:969 start_codon:yes stop_codon:yes gene_type:complete
MKKFLILGGAGFIGYNLASKLSKNKKNEVHIVDNFSRGKFDKDFKVLSKLQNVKLKNIDLLKNSKNKFNKNYDYIFNLAAIIGVSNVMRFPYKVLINNVLIQSKALSIAKVQKNLKKFIFFSTSEVYAGSNNYFNTKIPSPENTPLTMSNLKNNRSTYMISKIYGEAMCYHSNIPFLILRPHNIYGERMGLNHVIPEILKKIKNLKDKELLKVFTPKHTRSFCYIDDAINQIIKLTNSSFKNEDFNIGNDKDEISIYQLVRKCLKILNKKNKILPLKNIHNSPKRRCPSMKKTFSCINRSKFTKLNDGINKMLKWYENNKLI